MAQKKKATSAKTNTRAPRTRDNDTLIKSKAPHLTKIGFLNLPRAATFKNAGFRLRIPIALSATLVKRKDIQDTINT